MTAPHPTGPSSETMLARMLRGEFYIETDAELLARYDRAQVLAESYNATPHTAKAEGTRLLRELFAHVGENVVIRKPVSCDYGERVTIGDGTYVNAGSVFGDQMPIEVGAGCLLGSYVKLVTGTHPLDPELRRQGWESAKPITVRANVWLATGVIVCPGVTIGENTVVGAGSVVTRDLPDDVLAYGNPARVIREIGPEDRVVIPPNGMPARLDPLSPVPSRGGLRC